MVEHELQELALPPRQLGERLQEALSDLGPVQRVVGRVFRMTAKSQVLSAAFPLNRALPSRIFK